MSEFVSRSGCCYGLSWFQSSNGRHFFPVKFVSKLGQNMKTRLEYWILWKHTEKDWTESWSYLEKWRDITRQYQHQGLPFSLTFYKSMIWKIATHSLSMFKLQNEFNDDSNRHLMKSASHATLHFFSYVVGSIIAEYLTLHLLTHECCMQIATINTL